MLYVWPGLIPDVSQAVERVCSAHVSFHIDDDARQDTDDFRRDYCYIEPTDAVLRAYEGSLRAIFQAWWRWWWWWWWWWW